MLWSNNWLLLLLSSDWRSFKLRLRMWVRLWVRLRMLLSSDWRSFKLRLRMWVRGQWRKCYSSNILHHIIEGYCMYVPPIVIQYPPTKMHLLYPFIFRDYKD